jgi:WD40 repeat protein
MQYGLRLITGMRHRQPAWNIALGLVAFSAIVQMAGAEIIYRIPKGFGWHERVPVELLENDAVQSDLGIDAATAHAIVRWRSEVALAAKSGDSSNVEPAEQRDRERRAEARHQSQLDGILAPAKQMRLHEIHLQRAGMDALSDAAMVKALGLTPEQQKRILAVHERMLREEKALIKTGHSTGHLTMTKRDEELLAVLDVDQQTAFAKLKGRPFDELGCLQSLRLDGRDVLQWNVAFSPDGSRLASTHQEQIQIWDSTNGRWLFTLKGHRGDVTSIAFGPDGKWLVSAGMDRTVRSWDVTTGEGLFTVEGTKLGVRAGFRSIALSFDGTKLAHAYGDTLAEWYRYDPRRHPLAGGGTSYPGLGVGVPVWSVAYSREGNLQACGRSDGSVYLLESGPIRKLGKHADVVLSVAFSKDGRRLASLSADGIVKVWDTTTAKETATWKSHDAGGRAVAFHPEGLLLASAGENGTAKLWDLSGSAETITLKRHEKSVTGVAFSPDGKRLAAVGGDRTVTVWELPSGNEMFTLTSP